MRLKGAEQSKAYTVLDGKKIIYLALLGSTGLVSIMEIYYIYDDERTAVITQKSGAVVIYFIETRNGKQLHTSLTNTSGFNWIRYQQAYLSLGDQEEILLSRNRSKRICKKKWGSDRKGLISGDNKAYIRLL